MIAVHCKGATVVHVPPACSSCSTPQRGYALTLPVATTLPVVPPSVFCVWFRLFLRPWGSAVVAVVLCSVPLAGLTVTLCVDARQAALCLLHRATVRRRWRQVCRVQFRGSVGYPVVAVGAL